MLFGLVSVLTISSIAGSVSVTRSTYQADYGTLTYVYFETSSGPGGTTPSTNTAQIPSSSSGSYTVARGSSAHVWSPQFTSAATINAGRWTVDLWAAGATSGAMRISLYVTNSGGTIQSTVVSNAATNTIGTSKTQVVSTFSGAQVNVPANGYVEALLTAPTGGGNPTSFTIYWGNAQQTNFQVPYRVLSA
jgi:hypothetical protein